MKFDPWIRNFIELYQTKNFDALFRILTNDDFLDTIKTEKKLWSVFYLNKKVIEELILYKMKRKENFEKIKRIYKRFYLASDENANFDHVFLVGMPKSGSTLFSEFTSKILKKSTRDLHTNNAMQFSIDTLIFSKLRNNVMHSHFIASFENLALLSVLDAPTLVIFRNIFDCIESRISHDMAHEQTTNIQGIGLNKLSNSDLQEISHARYAVEYLDFFVSWKRNGHLVDAHFLKFQKEETSILSNFSSIADFFGIEGNFDAQHLKDLQDTHDTRLRPRRLDFRINNITREKIKTFSKTYKNIDFDEVL